MVGKCTMYTLPPTPSFHMALGPMEPRAPRDLGGYADAADADITAAYDFCIAVTVVCYLK